MAIHCYEVMARPQPALQDVEILSLREASRNRSRSVMEFAIQMQPWRHVGFEICDRGHDPAFMLDLARMRVGFDH